ncbi:hypothetical protein [Draconibacterium mangrovi]|uniref:hypothetical protein n=1 Tax=Draconibacterium mangrovi TaxID=2697469 RepID=UPI0013D7DD0C|nr:hypothetical protein [Draconibacterium mangrovi]
MESNELRIGNLVDYEKTTHRITAINTTPKNDYSFCESQWINEEGNEYYSHTFDLINPIPLTEEWLRKFGFDDKEYKPGYIGIDYKDGMILSFVLCKPGKLFEAQKHYTFELRDHYINPIEYVHQLQNFYFAITGQELHLKS